ncbi:MAG: hypothetical protein DI551_04940 [Micavibrio aeruginosavorus]|uniref:Uncharacterized protein n=1 Tax=Micavibrio aeruginosavorus TaxID=349221 RepID=A0A2W5MZE7_9BACT|nr:MAG: hypothetical protein DI551_04940 [Micavibrio aeruginosavorus]
MQLPEQKYPDNKFKFVDTDLLGEKQNARAFRGAAYSIGIGAGFLILSPFLPKFEGQPQINQMVDLIFVMAIWMVAYAAVVIFTYLKSRKSMKYVLFMLNWFLIPTFGLWFILRVMDIFSNMPPELQK